MIECRCPPFGFPELGWANGKWQFAIDNRFHVVNHGCYLAAPVEGEGFGHALIFGTAHEFELWRNS